MPLDFDAALTNGQEVLKQCASWFFTTNRSHYLTQGFDLCDIEGHLYPVLMRYLSFVEERPALYDASAKGDPMAAFRSSLYQACRNACFAHHRMHVRSLKRGLILRNGQVYLDHPDLCSDGVQNDFLSSSDEHVDYEPVYKAVSDSLYKDGKHAAARVWALLWHENKGMLAAAIHELGPDRRDEIMSDIRKTVSDHLPDKSTIAKPRNTMDKSKLAAAVRAAVSKGLIKAPEAPQVKPSGFRDRIVEQVESLSDEDLAKVHRFLNDVPQQDTQEQSRIRRSAAANHNKKLLTIDFEVLSDALGIEVNPEMNPLRVKAAISRGLELMDPEKKANLPLMVTQLIEDINCFYSESEEQRRPVSNYVIAFEPEGELLRVTPRDGNVGSFIMRITKGQKWMSWVDGNDLSYWVDGLSVIFKKRDGTSLRALDQSFLDQIFANFDIPFPAMKQEPVKKAVARRGDEGSSTQDRCLDALATCAYSTSELSGLLSKPIAAIHSALTSLARKGAVSSEAVDGKTIWSLVEGGAKAEVEENPCISALADGPKLTAEVARLVGKPIAATHSSLSALARRGRVEQTKQDSGIMWSLVTA